MRCNGIILMPILFLWSACVSNPIATFEHGYTETYTTMITRAVGPTTQVGARGTLPQPAPDDTNSIWVAPNGNNANPGTEAQPVLTLAQALSLLGGAKTNVQIFRNGYVGELEFISTAPIIMATNTSIQAEEGEIAYIKNTDTGEQTILLDDNCVVNGIVFIGNTLTQVPVVDIDGDGATMQNCMVVHSKNNGELGWVRFISGGAGGIDVNFEYCILGPISASNNTVNNTLNIENCIVINIGEQYNSPVNFEAGAISIFCNNGTTQTININRSIIIAYGLLGSTQYQSPLFALYLRGTSATRTCNINIDNSYLNSLGYDLFLEEEASGKSVTISYDVAYSLYASIAGVTLANSSIIETITRTITNPIASNTPPLFADYQGAIDNPTDLSALYGLSLQRIGKPTITGSSSFFINSPLIGAGSGGVDVNPWDEVTTGPVRAYTKSSLLYWHPSSFRWLTRMINAVNLTDVRGNIHTAYDAIRRVFEFSFSGDKYTNIDDIRVMRALMADNGSMKMSFPTAGYNLFRDPLTGQVIDTTGTFDASTGIFTLDSGAAPMTETNWRGFWITLIDGSYVQDFYISANDDSTFTLLDKLGATFPPSGSYEFEITYILVTPEKADVDVSTDGFMQTPWTDSQAFREYDQTSDNLPYPNVSNYSIRFCEIEDPEVGSS